MTRRKCQEAAMMPHQSYQLYQIQRPKSIAEIRSADERAGRLAAALAAALAATVRQLARAARTERQPRHRVIDPSLPASVGSGRMTGTMEAR
jgi:hypothetical protein